MSSFVAESPVIRALLEEHRRHNLEYTAVALFQTAFITLFKAYDGYVVNFEQSVDRGRARVDLLIRGLDRENFTLYYMMVGEMKGSYKSPVEVEAQVRDRAREAILGQGLHGIYAFTSLGEGFRFWYVSAKSMELEPLDTSVPAGRKDGYVLLDSEEGEVIKPTCEFIKENRPLNEAPVVPSQAIPADISYEASQPFAQPNQSSTAQWNTSGHLVYSQGIPMEVDTGAAEHEASPEAGPSSQAGRERKEPKYREVQLRRRENSSGYKFTWRGGQLKTEKHEWTIEGDVLTMRKPYQGYIFWGRLR